MIRLFGATGFMEASRISLTIYRHYCLLAVTYTLINILLYFMPVVKFVQDVKRNRLSWLHPPLITCHHCHFYRDELDAERSSKEKGVRLSVRPSVCLSV